MPMTRNRPKRNPIKVIPRLMVLCFTCCLAMPLQGAWYGSFWTDLAQVGSPVFYVLVGVTNLDSSSNHINITFIAEDGTELATGEEYTLAPGQTRSWYSASAPSSGTSGTANQSGSLRIEAANGDQSVLVHAWQVVAPEDTVGVLSLESLRWASR